MKHTGPSFKELLARNQVLAFAHRGAGRLAPENTQEAFRHAVDLGFRVIETDIQASRDGTAFVYHDATLERLTGDERRIQDLSDREITRLRIEQDHEIPKLADVLESFPQTLFNLDAKTWEATEPMVSVIRKIGAVDRVCIGSFSDARIRAVTGPLGADTCHSMGTASAIRLYLSSFTGLARKPSAQCVQFPMQHYGVSLTTKRMLNHVRRLGLKLHIWTINDAKTMHQLLDLGVDGIMTDDCVLLKSVMQERGVW